MIPEAVQESLQEALQANNCYEAHQIYLSIHKRLLKQGESADARRYLAEGIEFLSSHGQLKSALDLAQKYLDCFQTDAPRAEPWDEAARTLSLRVLNCLPLSNSMTPQWIEKLLKISRSLHGHDDSSLILEIGRYYSKGESYYLASKYWAKNGSCFSELINLLKMQCSKSTLEVGIDLLAFAIMQKLWDKEIQTAYDISCNLLKHLEDEKLVQFSGDASIALPSSSGEFAQSLPIRVSESFPVLNFCQLIIHICNRPVATEFIKLVDRYKPLLISPESKEILARIEDVYFPRKKSAPTTSMNMGSVFNSMLKGMFQAQAPPSHQQTPPDVD